MAPSSTAIPMPSTSSSTCLDMHAIEAQNAKIHRDDSKAHHIIDDALFKPRQRFTHHRRHMLNEPVNHGPFHHNARKKLRHMLGRHHHHHKHGMKHSSDETGKKHSDETGKKHSDETGKKHSSDETGKKHTDETGKKHSGEAGSHHHHHHRSKDRAAQKHEQGRPTIEISKPARNVSFADLIEVNNSRDTTNNVNLNNDNVYTRNKPNDVIFFVGTAPDESDSRVNSHPVTSSSHDMPESPEPVCIITPTAAETTLPWKRPSETPPMSSARSHSASVLESCHISEVPAWIGCHVASSENSSEKSCFKDEDDEVLVKRDCDAIDGCVRESNGSGTNGFMKTDPVDIIVTSASPIFNNSSSDKNDKHETKQKQLPSSSTAQHNNEDGEGDGDAGGDTSDFIANCNNANNSMQTVTAKASSSVPRTPTDPKLAAVYARSYEDDISPIPPPWRHNDSPVQHDFHRHLSTDALQSPKILYSPVARAPSLDTAAAVDVTHAEQGATLPPPWRCERAAEVIKKPLPINNVITPTWRQFSNDSSAIRSPSVAATLDSMMPHPSCHSLRMSEAESHHSLHMHMQQLIEPPHLPYNTSHCELDSAGHESDVLQLPHVDSQQRIVHWVLNQEADPELPVHDLDFDEEYELLKQLELSRDLDVSAAAAVAAVADIADVSVCVDTCKETCKDTCVQQQQHELLPIGSTAKTIHVTDKIHRVSSYKRHSPPVDRQTRQLNGSGSRASESRHSSLEENTQL